MDVRYVNPFLAALVEVLKTMAGVSAERGALTLKKGLLAPGAVTGMIDLKGAQAVGSLAISFSEPAILEIYSKMLGETRPAVDQDVADLVGEITNMVTGGAKKVFAEQGLEFEMAIPSVLLGKDTEIRHPVDNPTILVPFATPAGEFFVEVCFRS